jgi:hypothetical protein
MAWFVEDSMSGGLDAATAQVQVTNVKVGGCVTQENTVECMTIRLPFIWGEIKCAVPMTILLVDGVEKRI